VVEQAPRLRGIVVRDGGLETLAEGARLAELAAASVVIAGGV